MGKLAVGTGKTPTPLEKRSGWVWKAVCLSVWFIVAGTSFDFSFVAS